MAITSVPEASDVPSCIVDREQWVCWRTQKRDGKRTKVPINPHTNLFGSATDADSWSDFETARATVVQGSADGVGFVFSDDDPFVGVDLDDCRVPETGSLIDEAETIVAELDSYTEVSPSGTGVHILVEGALPGDRNRKDWVECYDTKRFFTVTGEHVDGTPAAIGTREEPLVWLYREYLDPGYEPEPAHDPTPPTEGESNAVSEGWDQDGSTTAGSDGNELSDQSVVDRAQNAANGEKFGRLWWGNTQGYESQSEADMALCSLLAFWTGGDSSQIDRLFRDSGLMRPKWDEQHFADGSTYGEKTIERVLQFTDDVYTTADSGSLRDPADSGETQLSGGELGEVDRRSSEPQPSRGGSTGARAPAREESELPTDVIELRELVDRLQTQVERLEADNQRLRAELDAERDHDDELPVNESSGWLASLLGR